MRGLSGFVRTTKHNKIEARDGIKEGKKKSFRGGALSASIIPFVWKFIEGVLQIERYTVLVRGLPLGRKLIPEERRVLSYHWCFFSFFFFPFLLWGIG